MPRTATATSAAALTARIVRRLLAQPGEWTAAALADDLGETRPRVARIVREIVQEWGATFTPGLGPEQRITLILPGAMVTP